MPTKTVEVTFVGADGNERKVYFRYNDNVESIRRVYPGSVVRIGTIGENFVFTPEARCM